MAAPRRRRSAGPDCNQSDAPASRQRDGRAPGIHGDRAGNEPFQGPDVEDPAGEHEDADQHHRGRGRGRGAGIRRESVDGLEGSWSSPGQATDVGPRRTGKERHRRRKDSAFVERFPFPSYRLPIDEGTILTPGQLAAVSQYRGATISRTTASMPSIALEEQIRDSPRRRPTHTHDAYPPIVPACPGCKAVCIIVGVETGTVPGGGCSRDDRDESRARRPPSAGQGTSGCSDARTKPGETRPRRRHQRPRSIGRDALRREETNVVTIRNKAIRRVQAGMECPAACDRSREALIEGLEGRCLPTAGVSQPVPALRASPKHTRAPPRSPHRRPPVPRGGQLDGGNGQRPGQLDTLSQTGRVRTLSLQRSSGAFRPPLPPGGSTSRGAVRRDSWTPSSWGSGATTRHRPPWPASPLGPARRSRRDPAATSSIPEGASSLIGWAPGGTTMSTHPWPIHPARSAGWKAGEAPGPTRGRRARCRWVR